MNFSFYISGRGGRLNKLIDLNHEILGSTKVVITDSRDALYLEDKLSRKGIKLYYFNFEKSKEEETDANLSLSSFILAQFLSYDIKYCFCFGDNILKGDLLKVYQNRIINFHPSILPLFPGRKAIDKALASDTTILLGNTAHFIDSGVDTGPIIMQSVVGKDYFDTHGYDGILDLQIPMLTTIYQLLIGNYKLEILCNDFSGIKSKPSFYISPALIL